MNKEEHLLTILAEECSEVQKEVSKSLRFGLDNCAPSNPYVTNRELIVKEYIQIKAIIEMLVERGILVFPDHENYILNCKKHDTLAYMNKSIELGTLQP